MKRDFLKLKQHWDSRLPFMILIAGFAFLILVGTILLLLPISTKGQDVRFIDALFLSTSAVCVTGLVSNPQPLSELLSPFGVIVLWLLVEIGGLGFITLGTAAISFRKKSVTSAASNLMKEAMNQNSLRDLLPFGRRIVITSFSIQGIGFLVNALAFKIGGFSWGESFYYSFFHTASSFNNAGFDIFGTTSLLNLRTNHLLMISTAILIILGGLGFVVIFDILKKKKYRKLSVHSKIVINATITIMLLGTFLIKLSDWDTMTWGDALLQVIFARTAGFYTVNLATLRNSVVIILCFIMFIGGSPASIAGGVKTTTIYTIVKTIITFGKGKKRLIAHDREIDSESIIKSFVLVNLSLIFIATMTIIITLIEKDLSMKDITFEVVSAFATCGTSMGITAQFSTASKVCIIILMFFGRLGPITFISLLNTGTGYGEYLVSYPKENIIIG